VEGCTVTATGLALSAANSHTFMLEGVSVEELLPIKEA